MQARAAGSVAPFDESVAVLREHLDALKEQARREKRRRREIK